MKLFGSNLHQQATFAFRNSTRDDDLVVTSTTEIDITDTASSSFLRVLDKSTDEIVMVNKNEIMWYAVEAVVPEDS